jgi:hypothetical protein
VESFSKDDGLLSADNFGSVQAFRALTDFKLDSIAFLQTVEIYIL